MKTNHIENMRPVGSDCFYIKYAMRSDRNLQFYLEQFNPSDYLIYKSTGKQRLVSVDEFLDFTYCGYIFYKKNLYDKDNIDIWIEYFNNFGGIQYLSKPFPPYSPEKIIIKK